MITSMFREILWVAICYISMCLGQSGDRLSLTLLDLGPLQSQSRYDNNNQYQCYVSHRDGTEDVESFRLGYTRDDAANNPDPPDPVDDTGSTYPRWLVDLDVTNNNAFGVFGCNASRDGELATKVSTVRMRSNAAITPRNSLYTQTVNIGDENVQIEMEVSQSEDLKWIKDNNRLTSGSRTSNFTFNRPIELSDDGIYECFIDGARTFASHGIKLLLVRACPGRRWGPPDCFGICDNCYNGGVCDETNGKCICPPGFRGSNCEIACGFNRFGEDCEFRCSSTNDNPNKCRGNLYCRPHPFGCTCISGFQGLRCEDDCPSGSYGASCLQTCHCASGVVCERARGICTSGCESGWSGSNCQVPDNCPDEYYGINCTEKCHCKDSVRCDKTIGTCSNGICAPGYKVYDKNHCEECHGNSFGINCSNNCHCSEDSCNKITGSCSGECTDQWVDLFSPYNCQTGLISAKFTTVNHGVAVPVHCTSVEGPRGNLSILDSVLSRDGVNLDNTSIQLLDTTKNDDKTYISTFLVDNIKIGEPLYCHLRYKGLKEAVISVNITNFYMLPELDEYPTEVSSNGSSVTITWTAWNENDNVGDGPVIGYIPYYKVIDGHWTNVSVIPLTATIFTFTGLDPETNYLFSVAAVRPGVQGEGPRSPELGVKTGCSVPKARPMNVTAVVTGQYQENVCVSWQIPEHEIICTSGVTRVNVHYVSTNLDEEDKVSESIEDPDSSFLSLTGLQIEGNYIIHVTLETSGGESERSDMISYYVPRIPVYQEEPKLVLTGQNFLAVKWAKWDGVNGTPPVVEYKIYYKLSNSSAWPNTTIGVFTNDTQDEYSIVIDELRPDTEYDIKISAVREGRNGEGPPGPVLRRAKTHCRDPDESISPVDVQAFVVEESRELINVTWKLNEDNIDCSSGVDYFTVLYSNASTQTTDGESRWIVIHDLEEGQSYSFNVTFTTTGGESPSSETSQPVVLPVLPTLSKPIEVVTVDCSSVTVEWKTWTVRSDKGTPPIVAYIPYYKNSASDVWESGESIVHDEVKETHSHVFINLQKNVIYTFGVSVVDGYGGEGEIITTDVAPTCPRESKTEFIIGLTFAPTIMVMIVIAAICIRKKIMSKRNHKCSTGIENTSFAGIAVDVLRDNLQDVVDANQTDDYVYGNVDKPAPVLVKHLESYMMKNGKGTNILEQQFQLFKGGKEHQSNVGENVENKQKNRFRNMVAYDHSRVVLKTLHGDPYSDYYNANYIKDTEGNVGFIACQGPNTASIDDFWRMIWQENVSNIVMLTNLVERGKNRCLQYWPIPVGETICFGLINVKLQKTDSYADYEIRQLCVRYEGQTRIICNWHFTTWPDMNIPDQPTSLIQFTRYVKRFQASCKAPLTVHCSAGVGRTGTFIALYSLMDVITTQEKIDIFDYVEKMRKDRTMMIQTAKQYRFLHECLFEFFMSGNTEISPNDIASFDIDANQDKLDSEFELLSRLDELSENAHEASPEEAQKCRYPARVPLEKNRPFLQSQSKTSFTNYINACFTKTLIYEKDHAVHVWITSRIRHITTLSIEVNLSSYRKKDAFVATQSPLPSTIEDFWRLIYDWDCPLIVKLNQLDPKDQTSCRYWSKRGSSQFGFMTVELMEEQDHGICDYRLFELRHAYSEKILLVHHLSLRSWEDGRNVTKLISEMDKLRDYYCMQGPPVVHCTDGAGRTGVFLTVKSEMERMDSENKFNVFNTVRHLRRSSHHLVLTKDDYTLCHLILRMVFSREAEYANI